MARRARRTAATFSLSFLDIMFCGFGAVVLLVLLISANTLSERRERVEDLRFEVDREETRIRLASRQIERRQAEVDAAGDELDTLIRELAAVERELEQVRPAARAPSDPAGADERIAALQRELQSLAAQKQELARQAVVDRRAGRQVRAIVGEGNRQYLTGLKLAGRRVLILIDSSASMLDRKIVDIVRRKVLPEPVRRTAPKWQRALATVEWLVANLPPDSSVQLFHFNTAPTSLAGGGAGWIPVTDYPRIDALLSGLETVAPAGGTNLAASFLRARSLTPPPDNIILLTDGLPTIGERGPRGATIDGPARMRLFEQAIRYLPEAVPVNTILYPIEGDPYAASLFWRLAVDSGGAFFTPTRDWP